MAMWPKQARHSPYRQKPPPPWDAEEEAVWQGFSFAFFTEGDDEFVDILAKAVMFLQKVREVTGAVRFAHPPVIKNWTDRGYARCLYREPVNWSVTLRVLMTNDQRDQILEWQRNPNAT